MKKQLIIIAVIISIVCYVFASRTGEQIKQAFAPEYSSLENGTNYNIDYIDIVIRYKYDDCPIRLVTLNKQQFLTIAATMTNKSTVAEVAQAFKNGIEEIILPE